jgi:hypothetical protein
MSKTPSKVSTVNKVRPEKAAAGKPLDKTVPKSSARPAARQIHKKIANEKPADAAKPAAEQSTNKDPLAAVARLLNFEKRLFSTRDADEARFLVVNDIQPLLNCELVVLVTGLNNGKPRVRQVSNLTAIDRTAPMISWFERLVRQQLATADDIQQIHEVSRIKQTEEIRRDWKTYAVGSLLWMPLALPGEPVDNVLLLARAEPWQVAERQLVEHISRPVAHRLLCQNNRWRDAISRRWPSRLGLLMIVLIAASMLVPVRLSVLAPAEISAAQPLLVTAPFNGVVAEIALQPGQAVGQGQLLVQMEQSQLKNERDTVLQALQVARAQLHKTRQALFSDASLKSRIAELEATVDLKQVELDYAEQQLKEARITAPVDGIAVIDNPDQWRGKPVNVGEKILQLADPERVELSVYVPVKDSIALQDGAEVRLFLDTDPLTPLMATAIHAAYEPSPGPDNSPAYLLRASLDGTGSQAVPRIGLRGTAKIYGEQVSLFYYLFRRPVTALRQWLGW